MQSVLMAVEGVVKVASEKAPRLPRNPVGKDRFHVDYREPRLNDMYALHIFVITYLVVINAVKKMVSIAAIRASTICFA